MSFIKKELDQKISFDAFKNQVLSNELLLDGTNPILTPSNSSNIAGILINFSHPTFSILILFIAPSATLEFTTAAIAISSNPTAPSAILLDNIASPAIFSLVTAPALIADESTALSAISSEPTAPSAMLLDTNVFFS